jgi:hypothetical protein
LLVIAVGGFVVRDTMRTGVMVTGNSYGLQALRALDVPRLRTVAVE